MFARPYMTARWYQLLTVVFYSLLWTVLFVLLIFMKTFFHLLLFWIFFLWKNIVFSWESVLVLDLEETFVCVHTSCPPTPWRLRLHRWPVLVFKAELKLRLLHRPPKLRLQLFTYPTSAWPIYQYNCIIHEPVTRLPLSHIISRSCINTLALQHHNNIMTYKSEHVTNWEELEMNSNWQ